MNRANVFPRLEPQGGIAHGRSETTNPANVHADHSIEGSGVGDGRACQSAARDIPGAGRRMDEGRTTTSVKQGGVSWQPIAQEH